MARAFRVFTSLVKLETNSFCAYRDEQAKEAFEHPRPELGAIFDLVGKCKYVTGRSGTSSAGLPARQARLAAWHA